MPTSQPADSLWRRFRTSEWTRLAALVVLMMAGRASFANHYYVPSGSMEPTLMPGDRIAVNMTAYGITLPFTQIDLVPMGQPERGDVVIFTSPADGVRLVKRVIAVGGDVVSVAKGHVSINGKPVAVAGMPDEEDLGTHRFKLDLSHGGGPDVQAWAVPQGQVLVMGDARGNSMDGRFFGLIPVDSIHGRAAAVYYRSGNGFAWDKL